jgi:hypothetical protein
MLVDWPYLLMIHRLLLTLVDVFATKKREKWHGEFSTESLPVVNHEMVAFQVIWGAPWHFLAYRIEFAWIVRLRQIPLQQQSSVLADAQHAQMSCQVDGHWYELTIYIVRGVVVSCRRIDRGCPVCNIDKFFQCLHQFCPLSHDCATVRATFVYEELVKAKNV